MTNRYVALARVSSAEQEREGFSLDVQEDALRTYAGRQGGEVVKLYRIAETASKREERKTFQALLAYCRENAPRLAGVLFYKVDRAARNLRDFVDLEALEEEHGVPLVFVTQPTENTPAGRMMRRTLANMASFFTEQLSDDVKDGMERRVMDGLFPGRAPFGYVNVRTDGRGLIEVHPENGSKVRRIFDLYARHNHTLDSLGKALRDEGVDYTPSAPRFPRSTLHRLLSDRSYIGEVSYRGQWFEGTHEPLVDRETFERVQVLLGGKQWRPHESVFGAGMVKCEHCGRPVVVEVKRKKTKDGKREYRYYRCAGYNSEGHPRTRVPEASFDRDVLSLFAEMKVTDAKVHRWVVQVLTAMSAHEGEARKAQASDVQRQLTMVKDRKDKLLELRLADEIDRDTFAQKQAALREREQELSLRIEALGRQQSEQADLAVRVFELSQQLADQWDAADIPEKRRLLEIVGLNWTLNDASLVAELRKPFDVLVGEPLQVNGGPCWI